MQFKSSIDIHFEIAGELSKMPVRKSSVEVLLSEFIRQQLRVGSVQMRTGRRRCRLLLFTRVALNVVERFPTVRGVQTSRCDGFLRVTWRCSLRGERIFGGLSLSRLSFDVNHGIHTLARKMMKTRTFVEGAPPCRAI